MTSPRATIPFSRFTNVNGTLYFTHYDSINGEELWKIDSVVGGDIPVVSPLRLTPDKLFNNNMLETTSAIKGVSIQAVSQKQTNKINEIGFFNVDDRTSKINGIAPGGDRDFNDLVIQMNIKTV